MMVSIPRRVVTTFAREVGRGPAVFLRRSWALLWIAVIKPRLGRDLNLANSVLPSDVALDVVIPATDKDAAVLPLVLEGIRRNLKHPVTGIYIIAPTSTKIERLCVEHRCQFVDEQEVAPLQKREIRNRVCAGREGWLMQQLIKLSADSVATESAILIIDADTVLVRPQVFIHRGKPAFRQTESYTEQYYAAMWRLLRLKRQSPLSFTAHHMIMDQRVLQALRDSIERIHEKPWYEGYVDSVNKELASSISDYDTYGNFFLARGLGGHTLEYWFNRSIPRSKLAEFSFDDFDNGRVKSVSFHSYRA